MASEWTPWVWHYYDEAHEVRGQQPWLEADECEEMEPYIHRDAARAWQAFRDWCDGTAEQWNELLANACTDARGDGFQEGYDRAMHDVENA